MALDTHQLCIGMGGLIIDNAGEVLMSFCCATDYISHSILAEGLTLRKAMSICLELDFYHLTFEGDCQHLIHLVNSIEDCFSDLRAVMLDIHVMLREHPGWKVIFTPREANCSAHHLAKLACHSYPDSVWLGECPDYVLPYVSYVVFDKLCMFCRDSQS